MPAITLCTPAVASESGKTNNKGYDNGHAKADQVDPRHPTVNFAKGTQGRMYITKYPGNQNTPVELNPSLLLYKLK